jgi:hypothetical protein
MAKKVVDRSVESLKTLLAQINALAPGRKKQSDGWIGDKAHMSRHSDHNPEPDGTVDARDFTHDPPALDIQKLANAIAASKDKRVSYMICNGKIMSGRKGPKPWVWRPYNGKNGHYHHLHVSVLDEGQDDKTPWKIESAFKKVRIVSIFDPPKRTVEDETGIRTIAEAPGDRNVTEELEDIAAVDLYDGKFHVEIEAVQKRLNELGYPEFGGIDGKWGTKTRAAMLAFRADNNLPLVPTIDDQLMAALMVAKPRYVNPERANATVADLRAEGAEDVKAADNTQIAGTVAAGVGVAGGAANLVDQFEDYGGIIKTVADAIAPIQDFISANFWFIALALGGIIVWQTYKLKQIRVEKHQTGQDVSA